MRRIWFWNFFFLGGARFLHESQICTNELTATNFKFWYHAHLFLDCLTSLHSSISTNLHILKYHFRVVNCLCFTLFNFTWWYLLQNPNTSKCKQIWNFIFSPFPRGIKKQKINYFFIFSKNISFKSMLFKPLHS